jgi:hypothetical protein
MEVGEISKHGEVKCYTRTASGAIGFKFISAYKKKRQYIEDWNHSSFFFSDKEWETKCFGWNCTYFCQLQV